MLRRARWLILLAITSIIGIVSFIFVAQRKVNRHNRPKTSAPLPANTSFASPTWEWEKTSGDKTRLKVRSKQMQQIKDPPAILFEDLEMEIHDKNGLKYDLVKSKHASLDQKGGVMYSDGEVEITTNLGIDGAPSGRLLKIKTSGVTLDVKSSKVSTERPTTFEFDQGNGQCVGATYDPANRVLLMHSEVKLDWRGKDDKKPPMHLESGTLTYNEVSTEIYLTPFAKLQRGGFQLDAKDTVVFLKQGLLDHAEAKSAQGHDQMPARLVEYEADVLNMFFTPKAEIERLEAVDHAKLVSTTAAGKTNVTANRFDMDFDTPQPGAKDDGSTLKHVLARGNSRVESQAAPKPGTVPQGARILTSEAIELHMRPGGKEIDRVATLAPGQVEFLPGKKGDRHRTMTGERLFIDYGQDNNIEKVRSVNVATRTEADPRPNDKEKKPVITLTRSQDLQAFFDPKTGQMVKLEQWNNFEYEEGTRRATADKATMDSQKELVTLAGHGRMWDETGSTSADEILLDQKSGDMTATSNVSSTRLPDKKDTGEGMLSSKEPLQARAAKMTTKEKNQKIHYTGNAVMWQASSRLQANDIYIDKTAKTLEAAGNVVSELPDQKDQAAAAKSKKANRFTIVKAPSMVYSDKTKLATYTGGVTLDRPDMNVKSSQLQAWFENEPTKEGGEETKLDHMFADGKVEIVQRGPGRTRTGNSEHAEYYLDEDKIILNGGAPVVVDSKKGTTRGNEIIWYSRQDKLTVDNTGAGQAVSRVNRAGKKK
ncbi:LPS export ABC transporter periplasmic protein LptC [uncultured Paludibaculum sp.]|uniref:LPS export ABC transporter periplasmic protein LptC n=1 Tax=uncultured Paludibaculum sp. TaxID=1765020 RepID=UPI002AAB648D|nr:LPS export ABC transporter periplasmic protein LptC [uncultured Paludibaculum sp.]